MLPTSCEPQAGHPFVPTAVGRRRVRAAIVPVQVEATRRLARRLHLLETGFSWDVVKMGLLTTNHMPTLSPTKALSRPGRARLHSLRRGSRMGGFDLPVSRGWQLKVHLT